MLLTTQCKVFGLTIIFKCRIEFENVIIDSDNYGNKRITINVHKVLEVKCKQIDLKLVSDT